MAKKKTKPPHATCGKCARPIDLDKVFAAMRTKTHLEHECGKTLVKGEK